MYIPFADDTVYSLGDIYDQSQFFAKLIDLVPNEEFIIGLGSYTSDEKIGLRLQAFPALSIPGRYNFRFWVKNDSDTPWGGAYYIKATTDNLNEIARLAKGVADPFFLCSHVIGFSKHGPIFSFHDAFHGEKMLVASKVSIENVQKFCAALNATYKIVANPIPPSERILGLGIPNSELGPPGNF